MILGDVSSNNHHPVDWHAAKEAGMTAVYLKATDWLPAGGYVNPFFGSDYAEAKAAGLQVGAYHFWHPEADVGAQLSWFRQHYAPSPHDLPPAWDAEINPSGLTWEQIGAELEKAAYLLKLAYGSACLYVNGSWRAGLAPHGFPWGADVWLATGLADAPLPIAVQFAPRSWPGFSGPVDLSVY